MWIYLTFIGLKVILVLIIVALFVKALKDFISLIDEDMKYQIYDVKEEKLGKAESFNIVYIVNIVGIIIFCIYLYNDMLLAEVVSNIYGLPIENVKEIINFYQGENNE